MCALEISHLGNIARSGYYRLFFFFSVIPLFHQVGWDQSFMVEHMLCTEKVEPKDAERALLETGMHNEG